ncbi:MAG: hydantoinase/oxoprolinase family protein [Chloroflexales bacterium]|nr:hydantoinase/oxoprolinase family protein [Chloroflexales bacterium]
MQQTPTYRFGFDIGGTFTDFVLWNSASGEISTYKALTTPAEPARAVIAGLATMLEQAGAAGGDIDLAIHGTTLITNALIERKGALTALITTRGHRDVLEIAREMRYDIYDLLLVNPEPLAARPLRLELNERLDGRGQEVRPVDSAELATVGAALADLQVAAVAVCLLHSYRNPAHEQQVGAWLREHAPNLAVALSSEVAPEIREYERMSTTVANAYVQPLAMRYLADLQQKLGDMGYARQLYLMLSSGGITVAETAARFPIRLVESGPAAGALAAVFYGQLTDQSDLVSFDMGGTTAKICVITRGKPLMTNTFEIARKHRFKRGSGLPVRIPAIELIEIGAGGGSIAAVDELGLLKVGPLSAGASPGPACYGQGGTQATVTDADLLLGYLSPGYFLGGRMKLDLQAAEAAIQPLADKLGMAPIEVAYGIHRVVNESMISATRVHVAERGVDPRRLMLMGFGGAGPVHADAIARALKMKGYVIPTSAGVASALGFLTAPIAFDFARTHTSQLSADGLAALDAVYAELIAEGRAMLANAGVAEETMRCEWSADLRHVGQGHEITVVLPAGPLAAVGLGRLQGEFYRQYEAIYGYAHRHLGLEIITCRLRASGGTPKITLGRIAVGDGAGARALKGRRRAYLAEGGGFIQVPVYERELLGAGDVLSGPLIVEERESTAVIGARTQVTVDPFRNLVVTFVAS